MTDGIRYYQRASSWILGLNFRAILPFEPDLKPPKVSASLVLKKEVRYKYENNRTQDEAIGSNCKNHFSLTDLNHVTVHFGEILLLKILE